MNQTIPFRMVRSGDSEKTTAHVAASKRLLASLLDGMKLQSLQQGKKQQSLPDGTVIKVSSIFGQNRIHITAPPLETQKSLTPRAQPVIPEIVVHPQKEPEIVEVTPKVDRHEFSTVEKTPIVPVSVQSIPVIDAKHVTAKFFPATTWQGEHTTPDKVEAKHEFAKVVPADKPVEVDLPRFGGVVPPMDQAARIPVIKGNQLPEFKQDPFVPVDTEIPKAAIPNVDHPNIDHPKANIPPAFIDERRAIHVPAQPVEPVVAKAIPVEAVKTPHNEAKTVHIAAQHVPAVIIKPQPIEAVKVPHIEGQVELIKVAHMSVRDVTEFKKGHFLQPMFFNGEFAIEIPSFSNELPNERPQLSIGQGYFVSMKTDYMGEAVEEKQDEVNQFKEDIYEEKQYVLYAFMGSDLFVGRQLGKHWKLVGNIGFEPDDVINIGRGTFVAVEGYEGFRVSTDHGRTWKPLTGLQSSVFETERNATGKWPDAYSEDQRNNISGKQFSAKIAVVSPGKFVFFTADTSLQASTATWTGKQEPVEVTKRQKTTMALPPDRLELKTKQYMPGMIRSPIINIGGGKLISFFCGMAPRDVRRTFQSSLRVENESWDSGTPIGIMPDGTEHVIPHDKFGVHGSVVNLANPSVEYDFLVQYGLGSQVTRPYYYEYKLLDPEFMLNKMREWANLQTFQYIYPDMPLNVAEDLIIQGQPIVTHAWENWLELALQRDPATEWVPSQIYIDLVRNLEIVGRYLKGTLPSIPDHGLINATLNFSWKPESPGRPIDRVVNATVENEDYTCYTMLSDDAGETWVSLEKAPFAFALWSVALGENVVLVYGIKINLYKLSVENPYVDAEAGFGLWRSVDGRVWELVKDDPEGNWFIKPTNWSDEAWAELVDTIFPVDTIYKINLLIDLTDMFTQKNIIVSLGKIYEDHTNKDKLLWMKPYVTLISNDLGVTFTEIENPFKAVGKPIPLGDIPLNDIRPWETWGAALVGVSADCNAGMVDPDDKGGPGFFLSRDNGETWWRQSSLPNIFNMFHANNKIDLALPELYKGMV
ncbi:MAG: hypothetical protein H7839_13505 [Magnetococcus sp. YQC-5]